MAQARQRLEETKVRDLILPKRPLVCVPHTATLAEAMTTLVSHHVLAVPVAAPPGHWIGAGGSMILEADERTGAARKQYIGIVTMLDILSHIAEAGDGEHGMELNRKMADPVTALIGHSLEGLSLWTLNPNTSIIDSLQVFSKGIHRALVPLDSHVDNISCVELAESAPGYRMVTQMDVVRFFKENVGELSGIMSRPVCDLGAISRTVYAITDRARVVDAIKCMKGQLINAVPIVASEADDPVEYHHCLLDITDEGRRLIGTFSATDLRGCHLATLQSWLFASALDFTEKISSSPLYSGTDEGTRPREPVTCKSHSSLTEVMEKAVDQHVHRVWVIDDQGLLTGVVSLTDIIRVVRVAILSEST